MYLVTNSTDPDRVVEQTIAGERHLIAKGVTILKPMELSGGYVPESEVEKSADEWTVPETVDHPWNLPDRPWYDPDVPLMTPLSANAEGTDAIVTGETRNPRLEGEEVVVDLDVNADRALEIGGEAEDVVRALENGEPLDVSSQYYAEELPPGEYDGEHRDAVEGNLTPDSVALLPNRPGVCSIADGCGFNPDPGAIPQSATANAEAATLRIAATDDPVSPEGGQGEGSGTNGSKSEAKSLIERGLTMLGVREESTGAEPAESGRTSTTTDMKDEDRKRLIEEITANSEIESASLEGMGDTCLQTTHEHIVANSDGGSGEEQTENEQTETGGEEENENVSDGETDTGTDTDDETNTVEVDIGEHDTFEDYVQAQVTEAVTANAAQREKADRVDHIVANSNEYGEDDREWLMDTPGPALERIENGIDTGGAALPGRSATANAAETNGDGGDADPDDLTPGVFN